MPYYADLRGWKSKDRSRAVERILALRKKLQQKIPPRTARDTLLPATWNLLERAMENGRILHRRGRSIFKRNGAHGRCPTICLCGVSSRLISPKNTSPGSTAEARLFRQQFTSDTVPISHDAGIPLKGALLKMFLHIVL